MQLFPTIHPKPTLMKCLLLPLFCLLTLGLYGQSGETQEVYSYRHYATQAYQQQLMAEESARKERFAAVEAFLNGDQRIQHTPHRIALVFHLLEGPKSPSLSSEQILEQLAILNQDFSREKEIRHLADTLERFAMRARPMDITFCFPRRRPNNEKVEDGFYRYPTDSLVWSVGNAMKRPVSGGVAPWEPTAYLNVWVVDLPEHIAGYAQMPGGPAATDGIVINYDFFGVDDRHSQGRTLTHLVGSYLGLHELWNEYEHCADDGVRDTPLHNAPNITCAPYKHVSTCQGNPAEMFMNFMDGSPDGCLRMFTAGQKHRIQKVLHEDGPRGGLTKTRVACQELTLQSQAKSVRAMPPVEASAEHPIIAIFPNPTSDVFFLDIWVPDARQPLTVLFSDLNGRVVQQLDHVAANSGSLRIRTTDWTAGLYLVSVYQSAQRIGLKRILINR